MKNTLKVIALGAVFAASVTMAKADSIIAPGSTVSVAGSNFQFNPGAATVTFAPNGTCSTCGNYTIGGASGTFATYFSSPNPVTFFPTAPQPGPFVLPLGPQAPHMPPSGPITILSSTENGETLTFTLTEESWTTYPDPTGTYTNLSVTGMGIFNLTGATNYVPENASFNFTSQEVNGHVTDFVTFSGTGTALGPVPEPSSLALLGTSLVGAAVAARRRFAGRLS